MTAVLALHLHFPQADRLIAVAWRFGFVSQFHTFSWRCPPLDGLGHDAGEADWSWRQSAAPSLSRAPLHACPPAAGRGGGGCLKRSRSPRSLFSKPSRWERRDATPQVHPDSEVGAARRASRAGASGAESSRRDHVVSRSQCKTTSI